jgi:hypothetical protein
MLFSIFNKPLAYDRKILYNHLIRGASLACVANSHRQRRAASMDIIKVRAPLTSAVAGAIAGLFVKTSAEVQAIGATAINQAVSLAIARVT